MLCSEGAVGKTYRLHSNIPSRCSTIESSGSVVEQRVERDDTLHKTDSLPISKVCRCSDGFFCWSKSKNG